MVYTEYTRMGVLFKRVESSYLQYFKGHLVLEEGAYFSGSIEKETGKVRSWIEQITKEELLEMKACIDKALESFPFKADE